MPDKIPRRPVCGACGEGIRPCAPCCRHSGWVHRDTGLHECGSGDGRAFPARQALVQSFTGS